MVVGAVIIIRAIEEPATSSAHETQVESPLGCIEIMGRSMVECMVERFLGADVEIVSVLVDARVALPALWQSSGKTAIHVIDDMRAGLSRTLEDYSRRGIEYAFVSQADIYAECDLIDWIWFHRGAHHAITRARDRNGPLDFWVADCTRWQDVDVSLLLEEKDRFDGPTYFVRGYVNQITTLRDFRSLVTDVFRGRCEMRPPGNEIRPGVWVEDGARIDRRARIVAPAYIGRGARVMEDTLITRCSNLESSCCIDYGSVIDDSSILTNSYVGIWLDVSHGVLNGNRLTNVGRNIVLKVSDPRVIRQNRATPGASKRYSTMPAGGPIQCAPFD